MYWEHCTSPEIDQLDRNIPVLLPVAAIEQHGGHLPLATDKMIGAHFCSQLNERINNDVLILPMVSVGCSEHHTDFTGSLTVSHMTFLQQLTEIASCVVKYGFKNLVVLNSHGGNQAIGQTFIESFGFRNQSIQLLMITWWRIALSELSKLNTSGQGGCGHAGEFETSLMLAIAPDLVNMENTRSKMNVPTYGWAEGDLLKGPAVSLYRTMKEMTPNGVYGDPTFASAEKGRAITKIVVDQLIQIISNLK